MNSTQMRRPDNLPPAMTLLSKARWTSSLLVLAALAMTVGCKPQDAQNANGAFGKPGKPGEEMKREKPFLAPVVARTVNRSEIFESIATTGTVIPTQSRLLRVEEAGRLTFSKQYREGDEVKKGEVIATIESETLIGDIARAQADVAIAEETSNIGKKSMDSAVREYQTLQELYSKGIAALKDVDQSELSMQRAINQHRQDEINYEKAKASLKTVLDRRERLQIVSPYDGLIVAKMTLDGTKPFQTTFGNETITDYDKRLVSAEFLICGVIDVSKVLLRCDVTSKDIGTVRPGMRAQGRIYAAEDIDVKGEVQNISRSVSADSRAFQVDVLADNPDGKLKPGMFGRVDVITQARQDVVSIPKSLITRRNNKNIVFLLEKGADVDYYVARETPVEVGLEGKDDIEITFGIKSGDKLVTRGFEVLQDKTPVTAIMEDEPVQPGTRVAENKDEDAVIKAADKGGAK